MENITEEPVDSELYSADPSKTNAAKQYTPLVYTTKQYKLDNLL